MPDLSAAARRVMVLMMVADRRIMAEEIEMIAEVHERLFGWPLSREEIDAEMDVLQDERPSLDDFLTEAAEKFNEEERVCLLRAAAAVSVADRDLHRDEKILLIRIGTRLGLGADQVRGLAEDGGLEIQ